MKIKKMRSKTGPEITIQNVVTTADLAHSIPIESFNDYKFLTSNLELYHCGYVKDDKMTGRVTVFANGKLISVGTKSIKQSQIELKTAAKILKKYGMIQKIKILPKVRNIVSRFDCKHSLPLEKLARTIPKSMYEPEQFPGLIYRIEGSMVALIFASGKGVIAGAKSVNQTNRGFFEVKRQIEPSLENISLIFN